MPYCELTGGGPGEGKVVILRTNRRRGSGEGEVVILRADRGEGGLGRGAVKLRGNDGNGNCTCIYLRDVNLYQVLRVFILNLF